MAADKGMSLAQIQPMDRFEAEQARLRKLIEGKPKAYEDSFMDPDTLPALTEDYDPALEASGTGLQSYSVEARYGFSQNNTTGLSTQQANEWGLRTEYRTETLNYGGFEVFADARIRDGDEFVNTGPFGYATSATSGRFTVRNLGLPITPNTFADTTAGDMYSEVSDAFRRTYRLSLGGSTIRGLSTRIYGSDNDLRVGAGERGTLAGGPFPGFQRSTGSLAWAGYSQRLGNDLLGGIQVNLANDVPVFPNYYGAYPYVPLSTLTENVSSLAAALGWGRELFADGDRRARVTLIASQASANLLGRDSNAQGIFLEGGFRELGLRHEIGAYYATPNLRFGDLAMIADNRGAYWRVDYSGSRLSWGGGLDYEEYNPEHNLARYFSRQTSVSGNVQYRLDRNSSLGGSASVSRLNYDYGSTLNSLYGNTQSGTLSIFASTYYQTRFFDWPATRLRATVRNQQALVLNDVAASGEEYEWEQDWITGRYETMRPELTTTLGWAVDRSSGETQTYPTAGIMVRQWMDATWSIGGNLRYTSRTGNLSTSQGLAGNINTELQLGNGWRLGATVMLNQATVDTTAAGMLSSTQISRSDDKSAFVFLRWDGIGGAPLQIAGDRQPGSVGSGSIGGVVFFDVNRDGIQQVSENGVPNVEVFLDGRFRVMTDSAGRFEFPSVGTGSRRLTLRQESVPLPWGVALDQGLGVEVPLRGRANASIPVVRVGSE